MLAIVILDTNPSESQHLAQLLVDCTDDIVIAGRANSFEEGIEMINRLKPQLVFLDLSLFSVFGIELLQQVSQINFEVIFTSAYVQYNREDTMAGRLEYLLKPIDSKALVEALQKHKERVESKKKNYTVTNFLNVLKNKLHLHKYYN